jgi:hypothetical protein
MRPTRFAMWVAGALMLNLVLAAALPSSAAQDNAEEIGAHELLWMQATAATLAIAAVPNVERVPASELRVLQTRLENAVVRLIQSRPPIQRLSEHLSVLPFVQEVTAAARAVVDAKDAADTADLESSRAWLDESIERLTSVLRQARMPVR